MTTTPSYRDHPAEIRDDFTTDQRWETLTEEEHAIWRLLFERQAGILRDRAVPAFIDGLTGLGIAAEGVPNFERLSDVLEKATGWRIVCVPGLVPDEVFFRHLSERRFPSTSFIRSRAQLDYLQEPDVFHDIYGHVPLLMNPVFADYMQAYGQAGLRASSRDSLHNLARLYWYTVEFGLIATDDGLRIYGSGIASSKGESIYALESPKPNRLGFDLKRVMRTKYRIDDFQETYFVIRSFEELFEETAQDFQPIYDEMATASDYEPGQVLPEDRRFAPNPPGTDSAAA
ncbi:phenylalanine-4-hydroxylase [Tistrella bauzanensis]|uniref:Phenylalanine-4-hydroxylase n=2 Tax=Tistrella bauzanensis TaxID=657419 RepID=A0ABQ1IPR2_9PROT|nr:phenylalanine 4-monooxygenase [Tistrella bauzanensis]GGB47705.1 phenylalanine-4-hydroxylase [Tistrella bauzanensis]